MAATKDWSALRRALASMLIGLMIGALGSAPTSSAATTTDLCARALSLAQEGALEDAETVASALAGDCPTRVAEQTARARAASDALAQRAARASDQEEQLRLARLALDLDSANGEAQRLVEEATPVQRPGLCAEADAAVQSGQFARAESLYAALEGVEAATSCRQTGMVDLADARTAAWPQRVVDAVTKDGLLLLLLAVVAFGAGVLATAWWRPAWLSARGRAAMALVLAPLTLVALVAWRWWSPDDLRGLIGLAGVLTLALLAGGAASLLSRSRAPLRIELAPGGGDDGAEVARQTVLQLHELAQGRSEGIFAVDGTDLHEQQIGGVLDAVTHPWVSSLLKLWDAVALRAGDRVVLAVAAGRTSVSMYEGRRLAHLRLVDAADFRVARAEATEAEEASAARDAATEVAAHLLWWRLPKPSRMPGLHGASTASSLALSTVAAHRLAAGDLDGAGALAARAWHRDSGNRAARLAMASADVLRGASVPAQELSLRQLGTLLREEEQQAPGGDSPLAWRIRYTYATGLVNLAVERDPDLESRQWSVDFRRALDLWGTFLDEEARRGLPLSDGAQEPGARPRRTPHPEEQVLWDYLVRASRSAAEAVAVALRPWPGPIPSTGGLKDITAGSRTDHRNLACGWATAYHLTPEQFPIERTGQARRCVEQIRLAAPEAAQRKGVLADPFLAWVEDSAPYRGLMQEWDLAPGPYSGIQSFGALAPALARSHGTPEELVRALERIDGRETLRAAHGIDEETLRAWRGAAQWLAAGVEPGLVNRYQGAGLLDREQVRRIQDAAVARRLAAHCAVSGDAEPSRDDRALMRRAAPVLARQPAGANSQKLW
ncbi:hypothetical protein [Serinicoccus kebangsaanensis]|uniref:hypothetical protein n=1 Tax=Serinicoccus kebangsaanensis TaxID=2602069 RepID=UPI00124DEDF1|nr:hypothetical protein [Serinicoccus kebangsaanensis]